MLQKRPDPSYVSKESNSETEGASLLKGIDLVKLMGVVRRHLKTVAICVVASLSIFLAYGFTADVKFTSQTTLLLGNRQIRAVQDISAQESVAQEAALTDNQIEVLKSERVLLAVIKKHNLMADPEFNGTEPPSLMQTVVRFIASLNPLRLLKPEAQGSDPEFRMQRSVISRLTNAIVITRVGKTSVLQVAVTAKNPRKAANLANGLAEAYLAEQIEARVDAGKGAGLWLRERLKDLRAQSIEASRAVERYRVSNNLVSTNGQLVTDQQLGQLNSELAQASADVNRKQSRYDNLKGLVNGGRVDAIVAEALDNSVINQLRQRLAEATKRYNEAVSRLGPRHESAVNRKNEISQYEALIFEELRRFLSSYEGELQVAKDRQIAVAKQLNEASSVTSNANTSLVQLRQLEQEASALTNLYQNYLQRFQETVQQESFPVNDARILSDAAPSLMPSEPRMPLLAAAGLLLGLGLGAGVGAYRELSDHAFRTTDQIEEYLGIDVFGVLPDIEEDPKAKSSGSAGFRGGEGTSASGGIGDYAIEHPFSNYAETLRAVKIGLEGDFTGKRAKIVGIVSTIPREGKSTFSMNFASLLALQGSQVALIDADLREAGLTKLAGLKSNAGIGEVLAGAASIGSVLVKDPSTGLTILPATVTQKAFTSGDLIASSVMEKLLSELSSRYDYVIVDLPPIGPVIDGRAIAHLLDAAVLVIEWGKVSRQLVRNTLIASPGIRDKLVGAVLNKVEVRKMRAYEPALMDSSQEGLYNRYYK